jgi:carboxypeptidase PM20D1
MEDREVKTIMKALLAVLSLIPIIIVVVLAKTALFTSKQMKVEAASDISVDARSAAEHLSGAVMIPTISYENESDVQTAEFLRFHEYLEKTFPLVHKKLVREIVSKYSLLYTWPGKDITLKPIMLMAHIDVVPVEQATKDQWTYGPFAGRVAEGYIWGRGTLDNKGNLLAIMEAVEGLLAAGFQPARTVYIIAGHDEERGGSQGAVKIAGLLKARGVVPDYVIDEGLVITDGVIPGVSSRLALIGLAEKGFMIVELIAKGEGGHSSMPPRETAVGILARAITRLENNPLPARIDGAARYMFDYVGREMSFPNKIIFANLWLTEGLLTRQLQKANTTNAMIRTTMAPTMLEGSNRDNVLPHIARAAVNFRILPGDTPEGVLEYVRKTINDPRVEARPVARATQKPSPVASIDSHGFLAIQKTIGQIFPGVIVAPSLSVAASDSCHFTGLTRDIYKFSPMIITVKDVARLHGINERIAIDNYVQMIKFYRELIVNSQAA